MLRVDIDVKLERRFRSYVKQQLQSRDFHLDEYDFNNADADDVLLTLASGTTDFPKVEQAIEQGFENPHAKEYRDLLNSWAYVVHLENNSEHLYGWRKINAMTQPRKVESRKALFFRNHRLTDVAEDEVFLIDPHFDFFVFEGITFIANKREFESSMNFREGMKRHRSSCLARISHRSYGRRPYLAA